MKDGLESLNLFLCRWGGRRERKKKGEEEEEEDVFGVDKVREKERG